MVAYIYFDHSWPDEQDVHKVIRSISKQWCLQASENPECLQDLYQSQRKRGATPSPVEVESLAFQLVVTFSRQYQIFIIIDAIDECDSSQRQKLLKFLRKLTFYFRIFISGRPHTRQLVESLLHPELLEVKAKPSDLKLYLTTTLAEDDVVSFMEDELKDQILQKLVGGANDMYETSALS